LSKSSSGDTHGHCTHSPDPPVLSTADSAAVSAHPHFNASIPDIKDPRCTFEVGLFQDSLPRFVKKNDLSGRLILNLDADMFTSTLFVLTTLAPYLKPGDIVFFDEFSCPLDVFRAFEEFVRSFRIKYEVAAAVCGYPRVCMKIVECTKCG
jgi:hypothetical protein